MHLLLPPSESKRSGGRGRPIDARGLSGPLALARASVLAELDRLVRGDPARAAAALLLPAGSADAALAMNAAVRTCPTMIALSRYTGVVYDGLDVQTLPADAQQLARRHVLIFSGLWGVVRGGEPIPAYRVPAKASLPGIGVAATFWRARLREVLPSMLGHGLVVDLRSSDYAAMWRPSSTQPVVHVRVVSPLPRGGLGVISYHGKLGKGRLARALLTRAAAGAPPRSAEDVAQTWLDAGGKSATVLGADRVELLFVP